MIRKGCCAAVLFMGAVLAAKAGEGNRDTFLGFRLLVLDKHQARWAPDTGTGDHPLRYAFVAAPTRFAGARNCGEMAPPVGLLARWGLEFKRFKHETAAAFRMWAKAARIVFVYESDPAKADILIGAQGMPQGRAFTNVTLKDGAAPGSKVIVQSLICLNPETGWKIGFDGNLDVYDVRYTIAHEIGHAIGLDHPSATGELMSYRYDERFNALQAGDVAGAVALYGAPRGGAPALADSGPPAQPASNGIRPLLPSELGLGSEERKQHR